MKQDKETINKNQVAAFDLATNTGYCCAHESGSWCFIESKARNGNKQHGALRATLIAFLGKWGIRQVVAEDINVNNHFNDMRKLSEFRGILLEVCDELDLPEPEFVNVATLKKWATGNGRATKLDMVNACVSRYNHRPKNDDEADAMHLYHYYLRKHRIS